MNQRAEQVTRFLSLSHTLVFSYLIKADDDTYAVTEADRELLDLHVAKDAHGKLIHVMDGSEPPIRRYR